jgi:hypothetical protein
MRDVTIYIPGFQTLSLSLSLAKGGSRLNDEVTLRFSSIAFWRHPPPVADLPRLHSLFADSAAHWPSHSAFRHWL